MRKKKTAKKTTNRNDTSSKSRKVVKKKAKTVRKKVAKTRNAGSMTESMFWSWIRSSLRRRAMRGWKPIQNVRNKQRVPYIGINKRRKYSYICEECKNQFDGKSVAVHHIEECGSLTCADDLKGFVERLFCEEDGLQLLCNKCHNKKHEK